jgi:hypothetical protein
MPNVAIHRSTASASWNRMLPDSEWQTTFAWGRNDQQPGTASNAWLLESAWIQGGTHTFFGRAERVAKDELFLPGELLFGRPFTINSLSLGYIEDFFRRANLRIGVGGLMTGYRYPHVLDESYGNRPVSYLLFLRARL